MKLKVDVRFRYRRFILEADGKWTYDEDAEPRFDLVDDAELHFTCSDMAFNGWHLSFRNPVMESGGNLRDHVKSIGADSAFGFTEEGGNTVMNVGRDWLDEAIVTPVAD